MYVLNNCRTTTTHAHLHIPSSIVICRKYILFLDHMFICFPDYILCIYILSYSTAKMCRAGFSSLKWKLWIALYMLESKRTVARPDAPARPKTSEQRGSFLGEAEILTSRKRVVAKYTASWGTKCHRKFN